MFKNKKIFSWCLYDWANSAYATVVLSAFLPIYFSKVAASTLSPNQATVYWSYTIVIALFLISILSPIIGAIADNTNKKTVLFKVFVIVGVVFTSLLYFIETGDWLKASIIFIISNIGFALAEIFYNSFLKYIAKKEDINYVSSLGYSMGYIGGGLLLAITVYIFSSVNNFSFSARLSFLLVSIWWIIFTLPIFKYVKEPVVRKNFIDKNYIKSGFVTLYETYKDIKRFKQLSIFLLAFWIYNDGIGTIIKLATIYGAELGISPFALVGALLATQIVGAPFTLLFNKMANKIGTKNSIFAGLFIYLLISIGAYFISSAMHFYILAILVGTVQGGTQALSRSLFASMVPVGKSGEFFGFYGMSSRFAGIVGPLFFAIVSQVSGSSRIGVLSLIVFFVLGIVALYHVNEKEGMEVALNY